MTGLWREVIERAGGRCECRGACGRKHNDDPAGRCTRENAETALLHAVPREPVTTRVAASLPADAMHALCGRCHDTTARKQAARSAEALRAEADANALF
jgi:hypothetical protein